MSIISFKNLDEEIKFIKQKTKEIETERESIRKKIENFNNFYRDINNMIFFLNEKAIEAEEHTSKSLKELKEFVERLIEALDKFGYCENVIEYLKDCLKKIEKAVNEMKNCDELPFDEIKILGAIIKHINDLTDRIQITQKRSI